MNALKPIRYLTDEEVSPGDVIRWGKGARWALVCETEPATPQGALYRLMWAFGADVGTWVPSEAFSIEGWHRADQNGHALHMRYGKHAAKDRRDAEKDATTVLGYKADGWYSS